MFDPNAGSPACGVGAQEAPTVPDLSSLSPLTISLLPSEVRFEKSRLTPALTRTSAKLSSPQKHPPAFSRGPDWSESLVQ
jgi:hypothetical protein